VSQIARSPGAAWQKREIATAFIEDRRQLIPMLREQEELIVALAGRARPISRFCDLGAGAGALSEVALEAFPGSSAVLVDFSEPMLAAARSRLAHRAGRWEAVEADLSDPGWRERLPDEGRFDAVFSAFCIHHLPDARKRELYAEVFELLEPGGVFLNWEHVSEEGLASGMFEDYFVRELIRLERTRPDPRSPEVVEREFREREDGEDNRLAPAQLQCRWLEQIGFRGVDVYFRWVELAIIAGLKPTGGSGGL
jgi:tRNA (cmo5U34)-methyltransferase